MLSGDEEVGYSYKSKQAENAPFNNMVVAKASDGSQYSKDSVGVGFSGQDFVYSDAYMNLFGDGSVFDNHYSLMQTQSDRTVIPPGFEALAQWFDGPIEIKKEVGSASSSSYSIPKVQLDSKNHAYMDMFGSGSIALMQAQFDGRYIPPRIEASVPWSADPVDNKKKVGSASSSSYSISKVQFDSKGIGSSHSWEKNWIAPCNSSLQAEEAAAEQPYLTGSSSFPAVPESFHFDNKLDTPSITGNSGLKMSTGACSLSSSLPRHPPLFSSGQKKFDVSASSGYYPAHNNLGSVEFPSRWDPYDIRSPYPYNSQNKVLGKDKLTSYSPGISTPKLPPHSLNALKSMDMASFSHQPSFSIDPFFQAPAGYVYPSPEENLGFNKTVNPAELSTASSGTMSMGMASFPYQPSFSLDPFFQAPAGYFYLSPEENLGFNKTINPAELSTASSGTMSMGIASFPYQPSFSVDSFFQAPAGYFYLSPEENLGFNKTISSAEHSTVPSGTMSSTMDYRNLDNIEKFFQEFKQFGTVEDYSDHYYAKDGSSITQQPRKWAKAIQEEWKSLEKDLPDAIFVRAYESRMDLLRAVIVGPQGTPYHDGLFFFDIFFPSSYPSNPPHVHYHSGGLRINPNLYECGKVCLSLLNTWTGSGNEKWIPNVSTMLQVLVSIQALVLNEEPYYNEPGHTKRAGGVQKSKNYNESTFILSLKTMVYSMKKPPKHFEEFVIGHFCKRAQDILSACKLYIEECVQVGSVTKGKKNDVHAAAAEKCSRKFAGDVASHITMLVKEFVKIGAKDCDKYLALAQKAGPCPTPF